MSPPPSPTCDSRQTSPSGTTGPGYQDAGQETWRRAREGGTCAGKDGGGEEKEEEDVGRMDEYKRRRNMWREGWRNSEGEEEDVDGTMEK
ncbi:hypothetical protein Pmani_033149 [Petrolisthes manimaculis]|uniref:Uncharacterized protein n=1 Tax=Petrolisthes manimaculis TaxID=1843537 RepID=A0AAE1NRM3_9EUCA|nr:hypothetical protein Pmani_033149 [Petrolisthes manimaculis]